MKQQQQQQTRRRTRPARDRSELPRLRLPGRDSSADEATERASALLAQIQSTLAEHNRAA